MISLPLYKEIPRSPIELVSKYEHHPACRRCPLGSRAQSVCIPPDGQPGEGPTLLVVGQSPGQNEDAAGRVFVGSSGQYLRSSITKRWRGPIVYTNALSCYPGKGPIPETAVASCRPYLAATIAEAQPERILALGGEAISALTGRSVPVGSAQTGYQYLLPERLVNKPTPIFFLPHPASIRGNPLRQRDFEEQLAFALKRPHPELPPLKGRAYIVRTVEDAELIERKVLDVGEMADLSIDIETMGASFDDIEIVSVAIALSGCDDGWVWPDKACQDKAVRAPLIRLLENPEIRKVLQNGKSDATGLLYCWKAEIKNFGADTRLLRRLHTADATAKLQVLSELVGMGGYKQAFEKHLDGAVDQLKKESKNLRQTRLILDPTVARLERAAKKVAEGVNPLRYAYGLVAEDKLSIYNAADSICTARVGTHIEKQIDDVQLKLKDGGTIRPLRDVWEQIGKPANEALVWMEYWGVGVSRRGLTELSAHLSRKLVDLSREFEAYKIDPDSPAQVGDLLYRQLRLPILRHTAKGQPSTDADTLEQLQGKHPIVDTLLQYRGYQKLKSTYADGLVDHIRPDGRIHPTINSDGTRTGRVSVRDPNLNNIAKNESGENHEAKMLRDCFVAQPGWWLVEIDFSQAELRVAAALSRDPNMLRLYAEGADLHLHTARNIGRLIWKMDPDLITDKTLDPSGTFNLRKASKTINFAILYGSGATRVASVVGCSVEIAKQILAAVREIFPGFHGWCESQISLARRTGYVWTEWRGRPARRRWLPAIANQRRGDEMEDAARAGAERRATNAPIQGAASDLALASISPLVKWIRSEKIPAYLMLNIYDALIFEAREDVLDTVIKKATYEMTKHDCGGVPLVVDVKVGKSWGSMKSWH